MSNVGTNPSCSSSAQISEPLPELDLAYLAPEAAKEAVFERYSSGAAARKKLESVINQPLSGSFYFYSGELLGDPKVGPNPMQFIGADHRAAVTGPRKGRWVIAVPGTERTVIVTPEEIAAFQAVQAPSLAIQRP